MLSVLRLSSLAHSSLFSAVLWFRRAHVSAWQLQLFSYNPLLELFSSPVRLESLAQVNNTWVRFVFGSAHTQTHTLTCPQQPIRVYLPNYYITSFVKVFLVCNMKRICTDQFFFVLVEIYNCTQHVKGNFCSFTHSLCNWAVLPAVNDFHMFSSFSHVL